MTHGLHEGALHACTTAWERLLSQLHTMTGGHQQLKRAACPGV